MKRKAVALLLVVVVVVLTYIYTAPPTTVLSIDAVYNVDHVGQTVLLTATLKNVPSVGKWIVIVSWDPYIAQVTTGVPNGTEPAGGGASYGIIEGPFLKDVAPTYFVMNYLDNQNGNALIGCLFKSSGAQISGTGVIFMMNFTILHPGTTTIELTPPFAGENESLVLDSSHSMISHMDVNGLITARARLLGDINDDGIVDRYDATLLEDAFGSKLGDSNWNAAADLNGDNVVNILDAIILANHFLQHYP